MLRMCLHASWHVAGQLSVIEPRTFSIPQPQHGLHPGYMVDLKELDDEAFTDPEFEEGNEEQVFQVLKTNIEPETEMLVMELNLDYQIAGQPGSDSETDTCSLFHLPKDQKKVLWILMDEKLEHPRWNEKGHGWFVVLAALPAKIQGSRQWQKNRKVGSHYMSNWEWGEIVAAFSLAKPEPPTPRQMAMLFTTFTCLGPIARTCLESISVMSDDDYNHNLKTYLGHVDREIDTFIWQEGYLMVEGTIHQEGSHKIAIIDPSDVGWSYEARITTRWIAHKVFEKAHRKSQLNCFELYKYLTCQDPL
ncbi:hypothetical protein L873DRAFT_1795603 [Choiromyces venosus 120613-1]|uniref:Uncharacterized protein n=1 Tax=Choiromyces venosus 120613-1 TaxID=1336337 RepID=A0A3N4IW77_9PEZI|nr:hypothetical protein L873DRAFT_1795603 [Choiromyces venosus 120613-1]